MSPIASVLLARLRVLGHALAGVRRESRLKVAFVAAMLALLWLAMFLAARVGLRWLERFGAEMLGGTAVALAPLLVPRLLALSAFVLLVMLTFSAALLALALLFRSAETAHLVTAPLSARAICLVRLGDVAFFSSWSSAYLGSPLLLAYGLATHAAWWFYPAAVVLFAPFVVIPAALGTLATLGLVRVVPRLPRTVLALVGLALLAGAYLGFRARLASPTFSEGAELATLTQLLGSAQGPWWPSAWLADGLVAAAQGRLGEAGFSLLLLLAHALLLAWLVGEAAERWLHPGWSNLASLAHRRRQSRWGRRGRLARAVRLLPEPLRSLTAKDVRTFCRDFSQWSQAALFFGVLAVYVANLRVASLAFSIAFWQQWITMLNTVACLLVLATLTTRFVFPLISLEGKRFWILRLAPLRLATLVRQKFWLSVAFSLTVTVALTAVSGWRLHLPGLVFTITVITVAAASFALSGLAVGLGSLFPDFAADTPARVVSGTGGTLTFIVSLAYIVLIAAAEAALLRWALSVPAAGKHAVPIWVAFGAMGTIAVGSVAATVLPLRLGIASLERAEV
ncbi:MAG: hypothetical protein ACHQQS_09395 [Thermoanaerobaculales bacterium]